MDIALFSAGSGISKQYAPIAVKAGAVVVDNSSAFRADPEVPLVVPEINARRIKDHKGIIANPNCSAITTLVPLWPVHQVNPVKRLIVSTYQAASGGGAALMEELEESTRAYLDGKEYAPKVVKYPYAFNLFSHNTAIDMATGYNDEETKVIREIQEDLRGRCHGDQRHLHPGAGAACPFRLDDLRMRAPDYARRGARPSGEGAGREAGGRLGQQLFPHAQGCVRPGRCAGGPHPPRPVGSRPANRSRCSWRRISF